MFKNKASTILLLLLICCFYVIQGSLNRISTLDNALIASPLRRPFANHEHDDSAAASLWPRDLKRYRRELTPQEKRQLEKDNKEKLEKFQEFLTKQKELCAESLKMKKSDLKESLLYEEKPTKKEKCLIACILKRTELMDKHNKLSARSVGRIANMVSNNNALVYSIAMATAHNCNLHVNEKDSCEAAFQINKCIANEMKAHKIKLAY